MIGFNNGISEQLEDICIPITSIAINRGYGAFEFFEVINGKAFYGEEHIERFIKTLKLLRLEIKYENRLLDIVNEIIVRNKLHLAAIKMFALPHDQNAQSPRKASLYVFPVKQGKYKTELYQTGAKLITKNFQRFMPRAKSVDYLAGQYWSDQITDSNIVDILYHNGQTIQETSRGNIFIVKDGIAYTPEKDILYGITRQIVIDQLTQAGLSVQKNEVTLDTLFAADEIFLASTTKHVLPIIEIDGKTIGSGKPGKITNIAMGKLQELIKRY